MPNPSVKVLEKRSISDFEYYVKVKYKGKEYDDAFSLPGLKLRLRTIKDKKSLKYIIANAMVNAIDKQTAEAEEDKNVSSSNNSEG